MDMNKLPILQPEAPIYFYFFTSKVAKGSLTHPQHNHTNTQQPKSLRHPTLQQPCPLSLLVGMWCLQPMAPLLPIGSCKARAIGFGSAAVGPHVWDANASTAKNKEEGGDLALGGHQSVKILNNQLIVAGSGMWDVRAETSWGGSVWGDTVQLFGVANQMAKKLMIENILWLLAATGWSF